MKDDDQEKEFEYHFPKGYFTIVIILLLFHYMIIQKQEQIKFTKGLEYLEKIKITGRKNTYTNMCIWIPKGECLLTYGTTEFKKKTTKEGTEL